MTTCGFNLIYSILPAIILAISGAVIAYFTIKNNKAVACKVKTIEYLLDKLKDKDYASAITLIIKIDADNHLDIKKFASIDNFNSKDDDEFSQNMKKCMLIRDLLNNYEYMAIAIKNNILDEEMLRQASFTTVTGAYERTKKLIAEIQKKNPTAYNHFEELCKRWLSLSN